VPYALTRRIRYLYGAAAACPSRKSVGDIEELRAADNYQYAALGAIGNDPKQGATIRRSRQCKRADRNQEFTVRRDSATAVDAPGEANVKAGPMSYAPSAAAVPRAAKAFFRPDGLVA
jgi:hypothetical protein